MQRQQQTVDPNNLGLQYNLGGFQVMYQEFGYHWGIAISIFCMVFLVLSALSGPFALMTYPASILTALVSLGFCLLLIILFRKGLKHGRRCAFVYDDGFIYGTSKGEIRRVVRWTDIESFVRRLEGGSSSSLAYTVCSVTCKNAESFKLSLGKQFIKSVESAVVTHLYPSAQAAYLSGDVVHFGRLDVSQEGLYDTKKKTTLPWNEVESIRMSKPTYGAYGYTRIRKSGGKRPWASIAVGELENTGVLRRLIATDVVPVHSVKLIPWELMKTLDSLSLD